MFLWGAMIGFLTLLMIGAGLINDHKLSVAAKTVGDLATAVEATTEFETLFASARAEGQPARNADRARDLKRIEDILAMIADTQTSDAAHALAAESRALVDAIRRSLEAGQEDRIRAQLLDLSQKGAALVRTLGENLHGLRTSLLEGLRVDRRNKLLIGLLILFLVGQIAFLEYRWVIRPITGLAAALGDASDAPPPVLRDAMRRDEIGALAQALTQHFDLLGRQKRQASEEKEALARNVARQEEFRRASLGFQSSVAEIVHQLEGNAAQMSDASNQLSALSHKIDRRAGDAVRSTQTASGHVDSVAASIGDIASTLAAMSAEAGRTLDAAVDARDKVRAASAEAASLVAAASDVGQVVALIQDIASQTNLLALNATIEAARVGESGRGFAVVASEVKQLAMRAAAATADVRAQLDAVALGTTRISERVAGLVGSMDAIDGAAATIAELMRRQDAASQLIASSTDKTAADVRLATGDVSQVADMIGNAREAADLVTRVSSDVNAGASDLRRLVLDYLGTTERLAA